MLGWSPIKSHHCQQNARASHSSSDPYPSQSTPCRASYPRIIQGLTSHALVHMDFTDIVSRCTGLGEHPPERRQPRSSESASACKHSLMRTDSTAQTVSLHRLNLTSRLTSFPLAFRLSSGTDPRCLVTTPLIRPTSASSLCHIACSLLSEHYQDAS